MVTLIFEAEVRITEKEYTAFKNNGHKLVLPSKCSYQVFNKDIKFVRAYACFDDKEIHANSKHS